MIKKSKRAFEEAQRYILGGVNSPVRAFKSVDSSPIFINKAKGQYIYDLDGNKYIDYVGSWGPAILGHADVDVIKSIKKIETNGLCFGAPTNEETELCKLINKFYPSMEKIRVTNSGTEATMSAIRLSRGYTGRDMIVKFDGCYHGHADSLLVNAGSGPLTLGSPSSPGIPKELSRLTLSLKYNDMEELVNCFKRYGHKIACVIIEPIAGNMGCILSDINFLKKIRKLCNQYESILIFDEVMTGFRVSIGGAQEIYKVRPDITTLGKIIGGGFPVGAFGGKNKIMNQLSPVGNVYQAGTLSGNPIAMKAGIETIKKISRKGFYKEIEKKTKSLVNGIKDEANKNNIPCQITYAGGMFGLFFSENNNINNYNDVKNFNKLHFKKFFKLMLAQGIYLAPSPYESGFISIKHNAADIKKTIKASSLAFKSLL